MKRVSDPYDHAVAQRCAQPQQREKTMFGKKCLGIKRSSFLIDPSGKIAKIYDKVKPAEHATQVLADLAKLI